MQFPDQFMCKFVFVVLITVVQSKDWHRKSNLSHLSLENSYKTQQYSLITVYMNVCMKPYVQFYIFTTNVNVRIKHRSKVFVEIYLW